MEIAFILSLEHQTLPEAELKAVLKSVNVPFTIKNKFDGFLVIEIPDEYISSSAFIYSLSRLSLTHEVSFIFHPSLI